MVKRRDLYYDDMVEAPDGKYVEYSDYQELESKLGSVEEAYAELQVRCFDYGNPTHSSIFDERDYWKMIAEQRGEALDTACVKDQEQKSRLEQAQKDAAQRHQDYRTQNNEIVRLQGRLGRVSEAARLLAVVHPNANAKVWSRPVAEALDILREIESVVEKRDTRCLYCQVIEGMEHKSDCPELARIVEKQEYAPFTAQELLDEPVLEAIKQMTDKAVERQAPK